MWFEKLTMPMGGRLPVPPLDPPLHGTHNRAFIKDLNIENTADESVWILQCYPTHVICRTNERDMHLICKSGVLVPRCVGTINRMINSQLWKKRQPHRSVLAQSASLVCEWGMRIIVMFVSDIKSHAEGTAYKKEVRHGFQHMHTNN